MKLQLLQDIKNCGPPPLISSKPDPSIGNNIDKKIPLKGQDQYPTGRGQ